MKFVLLLPLALAACTRPEVKPPDQYPLGGSLSGNWGSSPRLRLALVGAGIPVVVPRMQYDISQNIVPGPAADTWLYGFDLPSPPYPNVAGIFQVVVFNDLDNNTKITAGEPVNRNQKWLIYSLSDSTIGPINFPSNLPDFIPWQGEQLIPQLTVKRGWNLYDQTQPLSGTNPHPFSTVTGYDISR